MCLKFFVMMSQPRIERCYHFVDSFFFVLLYHSIFSKNVTWNWNSELNRSRVSKQYFNKTRFYIYLFEVFMLKVGPYVKMNSASIYDQENQVIIFYIYRKRCIFAALSLRATINIFIQVIFPNVITYLDRIFKEEQMILISKRNNFIKLM